MPVLQLGGSYLPGVVGGSKWAAEPQLSQPGVQREAWGDGWAATTEEEVATHSSWWGDMLGPSRGLGPGLVSHAAGAAPKAEDFKRSPHLEQQQNLQMNPYRNGTK